MRKARQGRRRQEHLKRGVGKTVTDSALGNEGASLVLFTEVSGAFRTCSVTALCRSWKKRQRFLQNFAAKCLPAEWKVWFRAGPAASTSETHFPIHRPPVVLRCLPACVRGAGGPGYSWPSWSCVLLGGRARFVLHMSFELWILIEYLYLPPLLARHFIAEAPTAGSLLLFSPSAFLMNRKRKVTGLGWAPVSSPALPLLAV